MKNGKKDYIIKIMKRRIKKNLGEGMVVVRDGKVTNTVWYISVGELDNWQKLSTVFKGESRSSRASFYGRFGPRGLLNVYHFEININRSQRSMKIIIHLVDMQRIVLCPFPLNVPLCFCITIPIG